MVWPIALVWFLIYFTLEGLYLSSSLLKVRRGPFHIGSLGCRGPFNGVYSQNLHNNKTHASYIHNAQVPHGGWFPLVLAFVYALVMLTWYFGTSRKQKYAQKHAVVLDVRSVSLTPLRVLWKPPYKSTTTFPPGPA